MRGRVSVFFERVMIILLLACMIGIGLVYYFGWLNKPFNLYHVIAYEVIILGLIFMMIGGLFKAQLRFKGGKRFTWLGVIIFLIGIAILVYFIINKNIVYDFNFKEMFKTKKSSK